METLDSLRGLFINLCVCVFVQISQKKQYSTSSHEIVIPNKKKTAQKHGRRLKKKTNRTTGHGTRVPTSPRAHSARNAEAPEPLEKMTPSQGVFRSTCLYFHRINVWYIIVHPWKLNKSPVISGPFQKDFEKQPSNHYFWGSVSDIYPPGN